MKCVKAAGVVALFAAVLAIPSNVGAQDTDPGIPENGVQVIMTLDLDDSTKSTKSVTRSVSPARCRSMANHAHASHTYQGEIGYQATVICLATVDKISIEVWGDRKYGWGSFSVWRQHTDQHKKKSKYGVWSYQLSQHKVGDRGTHHYRTRAKTYSLEDGRKYSANTGGSSIRIRCGSHPSGYKCWD